MTMTQRYLASGMILAIGPLLLASNAASREQTPLVVAQQSAPAQNNQKKQTQTDTEKKSPPRPPATRPSRPQAPAAHPPAQPQRPAAQPQRPTAQPTPPAHPQRPTAQPQHPTAQPTPPAQPQRPAAQPQRPAVQPPAAAQRPPQRIEDFRGQRRETREGNRIVIHEPGRTIVREGGRTIIRHDDIGRFRRFGGHDVRVERRGNETFAVVERPGGVRIITVTDRDGHLIRRIRRDHNGREVVIIDNRPRHGAGIGFFLNIAPPVVRIPRERYIVEAVSAPPALLYDTLVAPPVVPIERAYSLDEIRYNQNLRERMRRIDLDTITFDTGSWEVTPQEAARLAPIAEAMRRAIARNPDEVFMVEGHTDAVGNDVDNLSLSDRRAEAVAIVLTEQYQIPPENLTTQGYGEQYLKVPTQGPERRNRRVTVRRITPLLAGKGGPSGG